MALLLLFDGHSFGRPAAKVTATKPRSVSRRHRRAEDSGRGLTAVEGRMGKAMIPFYSSGSGYYTALVGADLEAKPGLVTVIVKGTTMTGTQRDSQISLRIKPKAFKKESFSVAAEFDQLSPEVLERIRKDQEQFSRAFMTSAPERLWEGRFLLPLSSEVSSPFGYRRVINGTARAPHTGVDLRLRWAQRCLPQTTVESCWSAIFFSAGIAWCWTMGVDFIPCISISRSSKLKWESPCAKEM